MLFHINTLTTHPCAQFSPAACTVIIILPSSLTIGAEPLLLDATASTGQVGAAFLVNWTLVEWPAANVMTADLLAAVRARLAAASIGGLLRVSIDAELLPLPPPDAGGHSSFVFVLRLENQYAYRATARVSVRKNRAGATLSSPAAAPAAEGMSIALLAGAGAGGLVAIVVAVWCARRHCECCGDRTSSAKVAASDADDRRPISIASPRSGGADRPMWAPVGIDN